MKANKSIGLSGILLAAALSASAQSARNLSLQEAIDLSIKNSGQLHYGAAKVKEAAAYLQQARDNRLPDATISGSYIRLAQPTVDLKVKLGGGGSTDTTHSSSVTVNQAAYVMANVSMPLFAGFRIQAGIESAKYLVKAAQLDADANREEVIQNTIAAYSNLYKANESLKLVQEALNQSKERVRSFSSLEQNGVLARNDLLKAQLQQSNVELSVLDAQNNLKVATINMDLMLGLPEETALTVSDEAFTNLSSDARTAAEWESVALQNRKDAAALKLREKASDAGIRALKGEYYPALALTGGYVAADIPNLVTITNAVNVGLGLRYPPSSLWKTGAKVAQARAQQEQLQSNEGMLADQIRIQTALSYQAFILSRQKIDVYSKAVEQANENYRIVKNKYENSLATTTDLLEADVAQLQAKLNYAYSRADAAVAYRKLMQTAGILGNELSPAH